MGFFRTVLQLVDDAVLYRMTALMLVTVAGLFSPALANAEGESDTQFRGYYDYRQRIDDRTRGFGSLGYEELLDEERLFGAWTQLVAKGGVSYDATERIRLEAGLGMYYKWLSGATDRFEVRPWQAVTFDWPEIRALARWVVHHRFMLEERFIETTEWDASLRMRYRLAFSIPVNRHTVEPGAFYIPMWAEFYGDLSQNEQELYADKARYSAGLGYVFNKTWTAELSYSLQQSRDSVGADVQFDDNIIQLKIKTTVRIRDYLKSR